MKDRQEDKRIREKLASLETFPENIRPGKEELWNRLDKVLAPPKKKNKTVFLWSGIAACIAGLLCFFMMHSSTPSPQAEPAKRQMSATVKHPYMQPEMQDLQTIKTPPSANHKKKKILQQRNPIPPTRTTAKKKSVNDCLISIGGTPPGFDATIQDLIAY
ncbi:hypothetical protein [Taibaiella soli]|uniref:Uncharacterized protein n=1 Tax=Taibaiella soli TaxID=1649169 RepID=A0A2W2AW26_9BACT|nr:hypothetical protein [Taibaiella soli]PZF72174.1 hypothetical protein DN068_14670 [Taibaiella soli]